MLLKKSFGRGYRQYHSCMRLLLLIPLLSLLTSCTTFIPGLDRILFSNSSAKVGPLVPVDEQYPENAEEVSATSESKGTVEPVSEPVSDQKSTVDTEPKPTSETTDPGSLSSSRATDNQRPAKKSPPVIPAKVVTDNEDMEIAIDYGAVAGRVVLIGEAEQELPTTGTMITLTPKLMSNEVQGRPSQVHIIDMEDKTYQPRYSTIHAGDQVVFVNKDNIHHNVFSSSGDNAFDLGTYGAGLKRAVTLKEPGIVKIYCNIHSEMATFVAVGNQGHSVKVDDQGGYKINDVLPGTYEATIWNLRGETKRIIEVKANQTVELVDRIDTTAASVEPHKNKFGGKYSTNSALFEDEFY